MPNRDTTKMAPGARFAIALAIGLVLFPFAASVYAGQTVSGTVVLNVAFTELATSVTQYQIPIAATSSLNYTNGTASNQVDTVYAKSVSLAATTQTLALNSLTDPAGNTINFARVRELIIINTSAVAGCDLQVYQGTSNGWAPLGATSASPGYARYGGLFRLSDPLSTGAGTGNVTGGSSYNITLNSGANTVTFLIIIVGGSSA